MVRKTMRRLEAKFEHQGWFIQTSVRSTPSAGETRPATGVVPSSTITKSQPTLEVSHEAGKADWSVVSFIATGSLSGRPSVESVEPRAPRVQQLRSGLRDESSNVPIPNATVELETVSSSVVATTLTMADGYYGFNGVVPGEDHVVVAQNGYTTTGTTIQTTVNPASALPGNSGIDVTVKI